MQLVITYHEKVSTTSVKVAIKFGKRHDNLLRDIAKLECSVKFRLLNFEESNYEVKGKLFPMVIMSKDGFTMLVMSFTGSLASGFREEFIDEFNRMEALLRQGKTPALIPTYQLRILSEPAKSCPYTHWSVFDASHNIMLFVEMNIGSVNKYDLVDASIGKRWVSFREGKEWAVSSSHYMHEYDDKRGKIECKCYQNSELGHFKEWLMEVYKPTHLYSYLQAKYKKEKNTVMLDKVHELLPKLLRAA